MRSLTEQLVEALQATTAMLDAVIQNPKGLHAPSAELYVRQGREALAAFDARSASVRHELPTTAYGVHGLNLLQRHDEAGIFDSDADAQAFVLGLLRSNAEVSAQRGLAGDHTSGPWLVEPGTFTVSAPNYKGEHRARVPVCYPQGAINSEANMRRIVACVNALAPVPTQALEVGGLEAVRRHLQSSDRRVQDQVERADFDLVELASAAGFDIAEDVQPHRTVWGWGDEQGNGGTGFDSERDAILGALEHRYGPLWRFDVTNRQSRLGFVEFCQQAIENDGHTQGMKP